MTIDWKISESPLDYGYAQAAMEDHVRHMKDSTKPEMIWLLEHHPVYTAGTSANDNDLLNTQSFPVYKTGRGGQYTYHGPGQRVIYTMLNLHQRNQKDLKCFIHKMEEWLIQTLAQFDIEGFRRKGRVGIWVTDLYGNEAKIAAIGVRVSRWITFHGASLNVHPNLEDYNGIVPCGINNFGVTSMHQLGKKVSLSEVDKALVQTFQDVF